MREKKHKTLLCRNTHPHPPRPLFLAKIFPTENVPPKHPPPARAKWCSYWIDPSDLRRALGDETFQADFFELKLVIHLGGSFNGGILEGHDGNPIFHFHVCWVEDLWEFTSERSGFYRNLSRLRNLPDLFHQIFGWNAEQTLLLFWGLDFEDLWWFGLLEAVAKFRNLFFGDEFSR